MIRYSLVVAAIVFSAEAAAQRMISGAFAVNPDVPGQYGFTFNRDSPEQAENIALVNCGDGCQIVEVFTGGCGAYAKDAARDIVLGFASAKGSKEARAGAIENCRELGGTDCKKGKYGCNNKRRQGGGK